MTDDQKRFEMLLPFYLTGKIDAQDRQFIESYLTSNRQAVGSLKFGKVIQNAVLDFAPKAAPDSERIERISRRLASHRAGEMASKKQQKTPQWWSSFWQYLIGGFTVATTATAVVVGMSLAPMHAFHFDALNGEADMILILSDGVSPEHDAIREAIVQLNAVVIEQSQRDGRHEISIDLFNRNIEQHRELIESLQANGYLHEYTLIAAQ